MGQGYSTEEVVDWCLDYIDPKNPIGISKSRHEGRLTEIGFLGRKHLMLIRMRCDYVHH